MTTFRHVMMLRFDRDVTGDQKEALMAGLAKMPEIMDFIIAAEVVRAQDEVD